MKDSNSIQYSTNDAIIYDIVIPTSFEDFAQRKDQFESCCLQTSDLDEETVQGKTANDPELHTNGIKYGNSKVFTNEIKDGVPTLINVLGGAVIGSKTLSDSFPPPIIKLRITVSQEDITV